jgi:hypothetical protein
MTAFETARSRLFLAASQFRAAARDYDLVLLMVRVRLDGRVAVRMHLRHGVSTLTAAFEPGEAQLGVRRSTCPTSMRTPELEGFSRPIEFSSTVMNVPDFTVYVVPSANVMRAAPSADVWI